MATTRRIDDLTFYSMLAVLQGGMWLLNDIEEFLKAYGISHGRFSILLALMQSNDAAMISREIAMMLGKSKPTVARMLTRLASDGLIRLDSDRTDGRKKRIGLTQKANALLGRIVPEYNKRIAAMSKGLTVGDKRSLMRNIAKIDFLDPSKAIAIKA
jgi:DNA-binding MarR family transcriptional regulator